MFTISKENKNLNGIITIPSSKSESNRILIIKELSNYNFKINNLSNSDDTIILQNILNNKNNNNNVFDVGAAGTTMRFLTSYFSILSGERILTGSNRMKSRPIKILVDALNSIGANISYIEKDGYPPIKIKGNPNITGKIQIDSTISSQYITSLILIAPILKNGLVLEFKNNKVSESYITMTLDIIKKFGINYILNNNILEIQNQKYKKIDEYTIEGDWSSVSYWYSFAALSNNCNLIINGLKYPSLQGDSIISKIFESFGVKTEFIETGIKLIKTDNITKEFNFDFINCPDLAQTVIVIMSCLGISGKLTGLKTLKIKETNRIFALKNELLKFGINCNIIDDSIYIDNPKIKYSIDNIETYEDHRMAMSFSVLSMIFSNIKIKNPLVVSKSYPSFYSDLEKCGFIVKQNDKI